MKIAEEPIARLGHHADVPIAFLVERVLEMTLLEEGLGGVGEVRETPGDNRRADVESGPAAVGSNVWGDDLGVDSLAATHGSARPKNG
ncbi:MAG: hypothetical protein ACR2KK_08555 [Acidimicrobiales bacterium]